MWILFAILGAFSKSIVSFIRKKISKTNSAIYVFLSSVLITLILLGLALIIPSESISSIRLAPVALLISGLIQIVAIRANLYAFRHEDLSYITPMFALTPLYAALLGFFIIGEIPTLQGFMGILAIVFGVYTVTNSNSVGVTKTIKKVFSSKGARAGMLVPIAYAASSVYNKEALNQGVTPIASLIVIMGVMALAHIYVLTRDKEELAQTLRDKKLLGLIVAASIVGVGSVGFAALALQDAFTSYALSIRRLDVIITVILGWKFIGEGDFLRRIIGACIVTVGVFLVSFG